jgi:hypothetical protein
LNEFDSILAASSSPRAGCGCKVGAGGRRIIIVRTLKPTWSRARLYAQRADTENVFDGVKEPVRLLRVLQREGGGYGTGRPADAADLQPVEPVHPVDEIKRIEQGAYGTVFPSGSPKKRPE